MDKDLLKGIKQGLGFLLVILLAFSVYAVGFHQTSEIVPGIFQGDYTFNGSLNVKENFTVDNNSNLKGDLNINEGIIKNLGKIGICNNSTEGSISYDKNEEQVQVCNGSKWEYVGHGSLFNYYWYFSTGKNGWSSEDNMLKVKSENGNEYLAVECSDSSGTVQNSYVRDIEDTDRGIEYDFNVVALDSWDGEDIFFQVYNGSTWKTLKSQTISASSNNYWSNIDCDNVGTSYTDPDPNSDGRFKDSGRYDGKVEKIRIYSNINGGVSQDESFAIKWVNIKEQ